MGNGLKSINLLFFMGLLTIGLVYCPEIMAQPAATPIGQVVWVKGSVNAVSSDNKTRVLQRRSAVYAQDRIITGDSGSGEIVFTDGGLLSLRSDSSIVMTDYKFAKGNPSSNDKFVVDVVKGGFRTITGAISKSNPEGYQVNTPVATIGIRGTHYSAYYKACKVKSSKECGLSLKINSGSIVVQNAQGELVLKEGTNQIYARVGGISEAPSVSTREPGVLQNDVSIQPAAFEGPGLGSVTTGGVGGSIGGSSSTGISGPAKTVSGFCLQ